MKIKILFLVLLSFFIISAFKIQGPVNDALETYLERVQARGYSGSLLVSKNGSVLARGYGMADRATGAPNTRHTVFTVGSITKQFTAAAILKLQMLGKLSVQDPLSRFIAVPQDKEEISLHHLLTHTSGFPGAIGDDFEPVGREEFIRLAMGTQLLFRPGEAYEYSNVGYSLLGAVVEIVSGGSYEKFLQEHLFASAGMRYTGYRFPVWNRGNLAHGYRGDEDWGTLLDRPWDEDGPYWHLRANGGILSTVMDLYAWHQALCTDRILSEEVKTSMFAPHAREGNDADTFYGYGWVISETRRGTRLFAHNGGNTIFSADFLRFIDEDVVIIVFSNSAGYPAWQISEDLAAIVFGEPYCLPLEKDREIPLDSLEYSPKGIHTLALVGLFGNKDPEAMTVTIENNVTPGMIERNTLDRLLSVFSDSPLGKIAAMKIVQDAENRFQVTVCSQDNKQQCWRLGLVFEPDAPFRVDRIHINRIPPSSSDQE